MVDQRSEVFHKLAKDAGNQLRTYILSFSSAAAGVFFFTLTSNDATHLSATEKTLVGMSLIFFTLTAFICLYELRLDAIRFFKVAQQLEKPEKHQEWAEVNRLKERRLFAIYSSYVTVILGIILTGWYMILRLNF